MGETTDAAMVAWNAIPKIEQIKQDARLMADELDRIYQIAWANGHDDGPGVEVEKAMARRRTRLEVAA